MDGIFLLEIEAALAEEKAAVEEEPVPLPRMIPRCSIFAVFPDAQQTYLFATVIGGALIILMLEVVFR